MVTRPDMEDRLRRADPVPENLYDEASPVLLASILERRDGMTRTDVPRPVRQPHRQPPDRRTAWATAGAVMIVLVAAITGLSVWLGGADSADTSGTGTSLVPTSEEWTVYTAEQGVPADCLCSLVIAEDGSVWVADLKGLARFDGTDWMPIELPRAFRPEGDPTLAAHADGSVWLTGGDYLARYQNGTWSIEAEVANIEESGIFEAVAITSDGRIWVKRELGAGLLVNGELQQVDAAYTPTSESDPTMDTYEGPNMPLPVEAPDGSLWYSMGGWGVDAVVGRVLDGDTETLGVSGEGPGSLLGFGSDGSAWFAQEFWGASNWIGDDIGVLLRFDGSAWTSYDLGGVRAASFLDDGTAWFLVEEITGERLQWMNQYSEPGVYRFDGETWTRFTDDEWLPGMDLSTIAATEDGTLWIATKRNGVVSYIPGELSASGTAVQVVAEPLLEWPSNATTTTAP